jgi:hypothetical protein
MAKKLILPHDHRPPKSGYRIQVRVRKQNWELIIPTMSAPQRHTVAAGVEAWRGFDWRRQTWPDWLKIMDALAVGEKLCTEQAGKAEGGKFSRLYSAWLKTNGLDDISSPIRSWLRTLRKNSIEVEQFRSSLDDDRRMRLNHPRRVLLGYQKWKAQQQGLSQ